MRAPHDEDVNTMIGRSACDDKGQGAEMAAVLRPRPFFILLTLAVLMM
jgi:hypothetical protein